MIKKHKYYKLFQSQFISVQLKSAQLLNKMCSGIFSVFLLLTLLSSVKAIDLKSAEDSECFEIKKTVPLDMTWVMSQKRWYYPLMSRLDLYLASVDLSGKSAKELHEDEVYYDSCISFSMSDGTILGTGFHGNEKSFGVKPIKGLEIYEILGNDGYPGGTCYNTLTDNKTFAFVAACMANHQMTWGVMSPQKKLPKETVKLIYDHAESLGFNREHFTGFRYDHCDVEESLENKIEL